MESNPGPILSTWAQTRSRAQNSQRLQVLLAGGLLFVGLFFTRSAEQTRDSLVYALSVKTGLEMFHPHHLIYTPAVRLFYQVLQPVCPSCDAVFAGQVHNILWSVIGILAFYHLVKTIWSHKPAIAAALLLVSSRGVWELSTQTTMYIPSMAILALISAWLVADQFRNATSRAGFGWQDFVLAALLALAVLYHQANILFLLPVGAYLIASRGKQGLSTWFSAAVLAGIFSLASYILVYLFSSSERSISGFIQFCLAYSSEICLGGLCKTSPDGWGSLSNISPEGLRQLLGSLFWNFLVLPAQIEGWILPIFGLAVLALTGWHAVQILRQALGWPLRLTSLVWLAAYTGFFFWWLPSYQHPFVAVIVPLLLLGFLALKDLSTRLSGIDRTGRLVPAGIVSVAVLIAGRNFQARILPLSQSPGDAYREAADLDSAAPPDCVFLTSYRTWNHLRYYFNRQTAIQAKHPLSFFYLDEPLPAQYQMDDQPCLFVATTFLTPDYVDEDYSAEPVNAYQVPERWLAFISWLLDVEPQTGSQTITYRSFSIVRFSEGDPYLQLFATRRSASSLSELFQQLDSEFKVSSRPFQSWYAATQ